MAWEVENIVLLLPTKARERLNEALCYVIIMLNMQPNVPACLTSTSIIVNLISPLLSKVQHSIHRRATAEPRREH
jgi:hypothetical protein